MKSGWVGVTHAGDLCWTKVRLLEEELLDPGITGLDTGLK